jgi:putative DNA primase/helicase
MSMAINYDDVLHQLQDFGLDIRTLEIGPAANGKPHRCVTKDSPREKKGWFNLLEVVDGNGDTLIIGSYGEWSGDNNNAQKVRIDRSKKLTAEQIAASKSRHRETLKSLEAQAAAAANEAAKIAAAEWSRCSETGHSPYLERKGLQANGVRFDDDVLIVPMINIKGQIRALQKIHPKKLEGIQSDKQMWPKGMSSKGLFFQLGTISNLVIIAEGYATGASIHQATGLPTVIAFTAGNLSLVATAMRGKYPSAKILIAADDDYAGKCAECKVYTPVAQANCVHCGKPHKKTNTGIPAADAAALAVSGAWVAPTFSAERPQDKKGPTDFNDLHALEGLHVVRTQIEARLTALGWVGQAVQPRARATEGGGVKLAIGDAEELFDRYSLVYGAGSVCFDHHNHMLVKLSDVRDACADKNFVRDWQADIDRRKIVTMKEVGFDPTERDGNIKCNLWAGWPTKPKAGSCDELIELLRYLCSNEPNRIEIEQWLLKWLAYPIQNPGAKMKTALVIHGPQGTGKNLFFDCIRDIYGEYGKTIDQTALEDKHNDWASKKLFLIADEVIAQQEMHHIKNKLKGMVTGDTIRVNPKHVQAHEERNHCNLVFLSNEAKPIVLERDDRRYFVMWTPPKLDAVNYAAIAEEIRNGGIAALHDFLLKLPLDDFTPDSKPPMTVAKRELINISMDGWEQFAMSWAEGLLRHYGLVGEKDEGPVLPVDIDTLYQVYCRWSEDNGQRFKERKNEFSAKVGKLNGFAKRERQHVTLGHNKRQLTMIYPFGNTEPPAGKTLGQWNSSSVERVTDAIRTVKTGSDYEYA